MYNPEFLFEITSRYNLEEVKLSKKRSITEIE